MADWSTFFDDVFERAKKRFKEIYPFEDESEVSPDLVALRDAINSLPCPIGIVELRIDREKHKHIEDETCQLIRYDFSRFEVREVKYHGIIDGSDPEKLVVILLDFHFGEQDAKRLANDICRDFRITGFSDAEKPDVYFQFTLYNICNNFNRFVEDLLRLFLVPFLPDSVIRKFRKAEIDYNALYDLKADPILPLSDIIKKDLTLSAFVRFEKEKFRPITIEDLQEDINDIQLIPSVPESVKRVFRCAKNLHIFGYFQYHFFTVSQHYAFLALESAIKNRYIQSLGDKAILTSKRGQVFELSQPSYRGIFEFCLRNRKLGWDCRNLKVNGEAFPFSMSKLLNWLVSKEVITKWEREMYNAGIQLRHSLSHLETASIFTPGSQMLRRVAQNINKLYSEK